MIRVIHGGQTGVDRGAHEGAIDNGWPVSGCMPKNGRDELGLIPADVASYLDRCAHSGYPARTDVNIDRTQAVLIVVADHDNPYATPGTYRTHRRAYDLGKPRLVIDPTDSMDLVVGWVHNLRRRFGRDDIRMMVAGPRQSRWASGRVETAALLRRLKIALDASLESPKDTDMNGRTP